MEIAAADDLAVRAFDRADTDAVLALWRDAFPGYGEPDAPHRDPRRSIELKCATQLAGTLSGGEQQMLAMARAILSKPKLLLLDEPSMGLSPIMVEKIFEVVRTISKEGITVLLVEQNARLALQAADRGYVMDSGTVTMEGDAKQMLDDPKVRAAYLGE